MALKISQRPQINKPAQHLKHNYGKSPCLMGTSTVNGHLQAMLVYGRIQSMFKRTKRPGLGKWCRSQQQERQSEALGCWAVTHFDPTWMWFPIVFENEKRCKHGKIHFRPPGLNPTHKRRPTNQEYNNVISNNQLNYSWLVASHLAEVGT